MARFRFSIFIVALSIVSFIIGCSSGGGLNPVSPMKTSGSLDGIPIIGMSEANGTYNAIGLFGAYELVLNPDLSAELVSKRVGAIGEDYIVSGIAFFTVAPCPTCLKITAVELTLDGNAKLTFAIDHPFPKGITSQPPTAANRLDLNVFDLAMVIAPTAATPVPYPLTGESIFPDILVGADGYTTELANVTDIDGAMPYALVIDDSDIGTSTWNMFEMESSSSFEVVFNLSSAPLVFDMYLTMGYGFGAVKRDRLDPKYYNPEFNRKAAWKVAVAPPEGEDPPAIGNTWDDFDTITPFNVTVSVYDWQIGATVSTEADFGDADPGDVYAASEPSGVSVEIPGMNSTLQALAVPDDPAATGGPADPWIYTVPIANELALAAGEYAGLVAVTDERAVLTPADGRDFLIESPDGIDLIHYEIPVYATYQMFIATIVVGCGPITGDITVPDPCPLEGVVSGQNVAFTALATSGNGGDPIVLYEWDMDYDEITFDVDGTGASVSLGPFVNPNCGTPPEDPVTYTVAVRATDSCDPANVLIFDTCDIVVDTCDQPPIYSVDFLVMDDGDEYFDVAVAPDGVVLVVADHPATGNSGGIVVQGGTRTCLRFDNKPLANMQVINPGYGMANPYPAWQAFTGEWKMVDCSDSGTHLGTNLGRCAICSWLLNGTTASQQNATWVWCGSAGGFSTTPDVCNLSTSSWGAGVGDYGERSANCPPFPPLGDFTMMFYTSSPTSYTYAISNGTMYDLLAGELVGIDGLLGSNNMLAFLSLNSTSVGALKVVGPVGGYGVLAEVASFKTYGTADDEFYGGLDVTMDSAGHVVTLEDLGSGSYRFQKFDTYAAGFTHIYTSNWMDDGDPLRIDFDRGDDELYVVTTTGLHACHVDP